MHAYALAYMILYIIVLLYICVWLIKFLSRNPKARTLREFEISSVTHTTLGLRGDMGNQFFQIAAVLACGHRDNAYALFPTRLRNLPIAELCDLSSLNYRDVEPDASFREYDNYEDIVIPKDGRCYDIRGYRQAYAYFDDYASSIRELLAPRQQLQESVRAHVPEHYIALHIRRGDYLDTVSSIPVLRQFKVCSLEYYRAAIMHLRSIYPEYAIVVCTDSPDWAASIISDLDDNISLARVIPGISPKLSDFTILYLADAVIMSNSTYSWWACYLRPRAHIISPTPWWDPAGFIGTAMGLHGPYLHYPDWTLLDADSGALVPSNTIRDTDSETLSVYKLVRGYAI